MVPLSGLMAHPVYGLGGSGVRFDAPRADELVEKFRAECELGGEQWAMPFMRSTEACYVNRDLVEKLGYTLPDVLTWDFIWEVSEAATEKNPDGTFRVNGQNVLIPLHLQIHRQYDDPVPEAGWRGVLHVRRGDRSFQRHNQTASVHRGGARRDAGVLNLQNLQLSGEFPQPGGQCLFAVDSTAGATGWVPMHRCRISVPMPWYALKPRCLPGSAGGSGAPCHDFTGTVCLPLQQAGSAGSAGGMAVPAVPADRWYPDRLCRNRGYVPVTTSAQTSDSYRDYLSRSGEDTDAHYRVKIDATNMLLAHTDDTFVTPVFNGSTSLRNAKCRTTDRGGYACPARQRNGG